MKRFLDGVLISSLVFAVACSGIGGKGSGKSNADPTTPPGGIGFSGPGGLSAPSTCEGDAPGPRQLRRLTRDEYDETMRDLLGIDSAAGQSFAADITVHGYANNAAALVVSPLLADQLSTAAADLAHRAMDRIDTLNTWCSEATEACAKTFIEGFGARAYRRPMTHDEIARYMTVYAAGIDGQSHADGMELVLTAMLQSPGFLYRREIGTSAGDTFALTPYEVASELSYLFLGSMPDDALLEAAKAGELSTPDEIEAQARRLLATDRGRQTMMRFAEPWLHLDRLATVSKDAATYPEFTDATRASMKGEMVRFLASIVFDGSGKLDDLLLSQTTFVNDELAALYGVETTGDADDEGFRPVTLTDRHGLLGLSAVLTTHAAPARSSPVHRGRVVRERLLCQEMPPPPPGVIAALPDVQDGLTVRERLEAHVSNASCKGCHQLMDPIGFTFEHFDGIGRWRDEDGGKPVDATGEIKLSAGSDAKLDGEDSLEQALVAGTDVKQCFTVQWFRFAYAFEESDATSCALRKVYDDFDASGGSVIDLMIALTATKHFVERAK